MEFLAALERRVKKFSFSFLPYILNSHFLLVSNGARAKGPFVPFLVSFSNRDSVRFIEKKKVDISIPLRAAVLGSPFFSPY